MKSGSRRLKVASIAYAPTSNISHRSASRSMGLRKDGVLVTSALLGLLRLALFAALEHLEHAVGDQEATDDVDRAEHHRDGAGDLHQRVRAGLAHYEQPAEQHDA